ncbi:MAG: hypothetical protein DHS20C14_04390 [Phycisphaeraceae bacterium]|nr:MAG: hypothetical protein DHS20C14_04390 [Phycisphaeraceae bacterium]
MRVPEPLTCAACGYEIESIARGRKSTICPECGTTTPVRDWENPAWIDHLRRRTVRDEWRRVRVGFLAAVVVLLAIAGACVLWTPYPAFALLPLVPAVLLLLALFRPG